MPPSYCFDARHLTSSLYATGAFQASTPVLKLRGNECKSMCGFFRGNCLRLQKFLPPTQSPLDFAARSCGDLSSWHWNPELGQGMPGVRLGLLAPKITLLNFHLPHVSAGPAHSTSMPLLQVWMYVVSLVLYLSDFHSTQFLMVLTDGCSIL